MITVNTSYKSLSNSFNDHFALKVIFFLFRKGNSIAIFKSIKNKWRSIFTYNKNILMEKFSMSFSRHIPVQLQASTDTEYGHQSQRVHSWAFAVNSSQDHWPQRTTNQLLSLVIIFFPILQFKINGI